MTQTHDKKTKKEKHHSHHHHNVVQKLVIAPPRKTKGGKKKDKKEHARKERSNTKLESSKPKEHRSHLKKKESSLDVAGIVPSIAPSDSAINVFNEPSSTPTKAEPRTVALPPPPMALSPFPTTPPTPPMPPTPATPPLVHTPTAPLPVKWKAEDVAMEYMNKLDANAARLEYTDACASTQVNIDRDCLTWKRNLMKNQSDAYPVIDATLVKIANSPDDYVNLSSIILPHCRYPVLMGQMPKKGCEEEFWKATFQESVVVMYILKGADDATCDFFPVTEQSYVYYGSMFVNNRKVEKMDEERTRYTIEVLPNGFSNSIMANIYVHTGWESHGVPVKYANTTRSAVDVMNFVKTSNGADKLMVVSRNGAGRAGFFLSLGSAFCCINDLSEPRIGEIVKAIRAQRPNAVDSMKQFASLYLCLLYYIKKKTTIPDEMKQKVDDVTKSFENLIREDLSIIY